MKSLFALALLPLSATASARADEKYVGLFLQGLKIGYFSYSSTDTVYEGRPAVRSDGTSLMDTGLLGTAMRIQSVSTTWRTPNGAPFRMVYRMTSGGRTQAMDARFVAKKAIIQVNNSGTKSQKILAIPGDGTEVDDPMSPEVSGKLKKGDARTFYVLDPSTVSFVKNEIKFSGQVEVKVRGVARKANRFEIKDPRASMAMYLDDKGEVIKGDGPMGIEMLPVSRAEALGKSAKYSPSVDLAFATSLKTDVPIQDPAHVKELRLRITGRDLKGIPNGEYQTVTADGDGWIVDVHPTQVSQDPGVAIYLARKDKPEWAKASMNVPSNSGRFISLAKRIVKDKSDVHSAAFAIRKYVYETMNPNAGIGVLRDANEVLDSKEGVCRDYAVLTVTLLRAAGIPARLASGIVNWDGTFYYHAWAEAWDGRHWIGIDSTSDDNQVSAAHVKLGEGNVEEAFAFTFLDKAKISVLKAERE